MYRYKKLIGHKKSKRNKKKEDPYYIPTQEFIFISILYSSMLYIYSLLDNDSKIVGPSILFFISSLFYLYIIRHYVKSQFEKSESTSSDSTNGRGFSANNTFQYSYFVFLLKKRTMTPKTPLEPPQVSNTLPPPISLDEVHKMKQRWLSTLNQEISSLEKILKKLIPEKMTLPEKQSLENIQLIQLSSKKIISSLENLSINKPSIDEFLLKLENFTHQITQHLMSVRAKIKNLQDQKKPSQNKDKEQISKLKYEIILLGKCCTTIG